MQLLQRSQMCERFRENATLQMMLAVVGTASSHPVRRVLRNMKVPNQSLRDGTLKGYGSVRNVSGQAQTSDSREKYIKYKTRVDRGHEIVDRCLGALGHMD